MNEYIPRLYVQMADLGRCIFNTGDRIRNKGESSVKVATRKPRYWDQRTQLLHKIPFPMSLEHSRLGPKLNCELQHSLSAREVRANGHTVLFSWDPDPLRS
jgi:hypothetical protein